MSYQERPSHRAPWIAAYAVWCLSLVAGKEAIQVSENGFAFSKLRPYTTWEDVRDSARRFWVTYRSTVEIDTVNRLGVRYINRFPVRRGRIADYLANPPSVPDTVQPQQVVNALSRLVIHHNESGIIARVISTMDADESDTWITIDTDAFLNKEFHHDSSELWTTLEELRRVKNRIFFGSITEAAAKEFDE